MGAAALESALAALPGLVRACHDRMGRPLSSEDLEEAIQETGLTAWRRRADFRGDSHVDTWLYGIARYTILGLLNQRRRRRNREAPIVEDALACTDARRCPSDLADTGLGRAVQENLRLAGATAAAIFQYRDIDGMTFVEIGQSLSMNETTVKSRYYRALPALRDRLRGVWVANYG